MHNQSYSPTRQCLLNGVAHCLMRSENLHQSIYDCPDSIAAGVNRGIDQVADQDRGELFLGF